MGKIQFTSTTYTAKKGPGEVPAKLFGLYDVGHRYSKSMHEIHYVIFGFAGQDGNVYYWMIPDFPGCKPREELFELVGFVPTPDADFMDILNQKPIVDLILNEKGYVIGVKPVPPDIDTNFPVPDAVELSLGELIDAISKDYELPRFVQIMIEKSLEYNETVPDRAEENEHVIGEEEEVPEQQPLIPYKRFVPSGKAPTVSIGQQQKAPSVSIGQQQPIQPIKEDEENDKNEKSTTNSEPVILNDDKITEEETEKKENNSEDEEEPSEENTPSNPSTIATEEVIVGEDDTEESDDEDEEGEEDDEGEIAGDETVEDMRNILQKHIKDPFIHDYVTRAGLGDSLDKASENFIRILYSFYKSKQADREE